MKKITDLKIGDTVWLHNKANYRVKTDRGFTKAVVHSTAIHEGEPIVILDPILRLRTDNVDYKIEVLLELEGNDWFINDPEGWKSRK